MSGLHAHHSAVVGASKTFDPLTLSPVAWYRPESLVALADGDPVATWPDSSGNGRDMTQASAGAKPTYKTGIVNGLAVVRFDQVADYMEVAFSLNQPSQVFIVSQGRGAVNSGFTSMIDSPTRNGLRIYKADANTIKMYAGAFGPQVTVDANAAFHSYTFTFNGASSEMRLDGGTAATGDAGTNNADGIRLNTDGNGTGVDFYGQDLAELIAFKPVLGATDRANVESYLRSKYGTP